MPARTTKSRLRSFPERAKEARKRAGLSLIEASFQLRQYVPESHWTSYQTINRLEKGELPEERTDPVLLAGLAKTYAVNLAELSPRAEEARRQILQLLGSVGPDETGQVIPSSLSRSGAGSRPRFGRPDPRRRRTAA